MFGTKILFNNDNDGVYDLAEFYTSCPYNGVQAKHDWLERLEEVLFIMQELEPCDSLNWRKNLWAGDTVEFNFHNVTKHQVTLQKGPFNFMVTVKDI